MDEAPRTASASSGQVFPLAAAAVGVLVGFRIGLLPGGLVAVDVLLALLGWWLGSSVVTGASLRERCTEAWRRLWPPLIGALVLAWAWVLMTPSTRFDTRVRGEAFGLVAGYGNWQLLALGPVERATWRGGLPLQPLWLVAVAAQLVLVFALAWGATRPRARRRPDERDPLVVVLAVLGGVGLLVLLGQVVAGADGQTMLLSTWSRAAAFSFAAAVGALRPGPAAESVRAVAMGTRWIAVGMLVVLAVVASPTSTWWTAGCAAVVPVLAVLVVVGAVPWPAGRRSRAVAPAFDPWTALVAVGVLHGPALAIGHTVLDDAPAAAGAVLGLVLLAVAAVVVVALASLLAWTPEAIERRCVLVPPVVVALIVLICSATGAFHWSGPSSRAMDAPAAGAVPE